MKYGFIREQANDYPVNMLCRLLSVQRSSYYDWRGRPGKVIPPEELETSAADLLIANILAGPLVDLAPRFAELVRPGGQILLSGILDTQLEDIQLAYRPYFKLDPASYRDEWVCIGGNRL